MPGPTTDQIQDTVESLTADSALFHQIMHGPANATVQTENGPVPTVAKVIADISSSIQQGFTAGFVAVVANAAERGTKAPTQVGQLLIQMDTKQIFYASSTAVGGWTIHPVQSAVADAASALAAVATLTAALAGKMDVASYTNGGNGVVETAASLQAVKLFAQQNPTAALRYYGVQAGQPGLFLAPTARSTATLLVGGNTHSVEAHRPQAIHKSTENDTYGQAFALLGNPKRLFSWGYSYDVGTFGNGMTSRNAYRPNPAIFQQQSDRPLPGLDLSLLDQDAGQVDVLKHSPNVTQVLTRNGLIFAAGNSGQASRFGSGVSKIQYTFQPIYFNDGGTNRQIKTFDIAGQNGGAFVGVYADTLNQVWLLTSNPMSAGYNNNVVGAVNTPLKISAGIAGFAGKTVKKVRCDPTGGVFVLFTNGELWGGGGYNYTGYLGVGSTSNVLNLVQLATNVNSFELTGNDLYTLGLFVLQTDGTLRGAGYNGYGQLGRGNTTNSPNFVNLDTNVDFARLGGQADATVYWHTTTGDLWKATGLGSEGNYGLGVVAPTTRLPIELPQLKALLAANGGIANLTVSGYATRRQACVVCQNGKAFVCGTNAEGHLGVGDTTDKLSWTELLWSKESSDETIVDAAAVVSASQTSFQWLTSRGRILMAGNATNGFSTGAQPPAAYSLLIASPITL
jgi:alpha-tubulin suppressor-like RCC1 family protein